MDENTKVVLLSAIAFLSPVVSACASGVIYYFTHHSNTDGQVDKPKDEARGKG